MRIHSATRLLVLPFVLPLVLTLTLTVSGCGTDGPAADAATGPAEWTLSEELRIGSLEGETALSEVGTVRPGPDGNVYVLLPQEGRVAVFGPDGSTEASIGRQGEGPGEMMGPSGIGFLNDTLWVRDARLRRLTFYTAGGEHLHDLPFPTADGLAEEERADFGAPVAGGRAVLVADAELASERTGSEHRWPVLVAPLEGGATDTVATRYTAHDRAMAVTGSGGVIRSIEIFRQIFADGTLWRAAPDGRALVLVDRAVPDEPGIAAYRLTRVSVEGDTAWSVEVPYTPHPVNPARVDSLVRRYANENRSESEVRDLLFLPDHLPPVSDLVVGTDGTVWVAREEVPDEPRTWDVFDGTGQQIARVTTPPGLRIEAASRSTVWAVETDALDVPYVVRYRVEEGEPIA